MGKRPSGGEVVPANQSRKKKGKHFEDLTNTFVFGLQPRKIKTLYPTAPPAHPPHTTPSRKPLFRRTVRHVGAAKRERNRRPAHVLHRHRARERVQVRVREAGELQRERVEEGPRRAEPRVGAPAGFGREPHAAPAAAAAAVGLGVRTARVPR